MDYPRSGHHCRRSSLTCHRLADSPLGRARWSLGFDPQAGWPSHLVRLWERCESDRVADRPFALHPEALDRGGWSTRLASSVRAGV